MKRMRLLLVQHGEATTEAENPERPLTEIGRAHVTATSRFLSQAGIKVEAVWHSGKTRSRETAEILALHLGPVEGLVHMGGLAPNDSPATILRELASEERDLMIVGHLPSLQRLASLALMNEDSYDLLKFSMGGVICLERDDGGKWRVAFEVTPDLLKTSVC
jgi:phosphohistidine phosphatase